MLDASIPGSNCHAQSSPLLPPGPPRISPCRNVLRQNYGSFKRLLVNILLNFLEAGRSKDSCHSVTTNFGKKRSHGEKKLSVGARPCLWHMLQPALWP